MCVTDDCESSVLACGVICIIIAVMNRLINMSLSVNIAERTTEECLSVSVSWQQLSSQEAGLFLPSSINNATVYGNWEYLIHFVSLTPGIDDRGNFSVDDNDSFYALPVDVLVQGTQYMLWITADVLLLNGTTLHIRSLNVTTQIPTCSVGPCTYIVFVVLRECIIIMHGIIIFSGFLVPNTFLRLVMVFWSLLFVG